MTESYQYNDIHIKINLTISTEYQRATNILSTTLICFFLLFIIHGTIHHNTFLNRPGARTRLVETEASRERQKVQDRE